LKKILISTLIIIGLIVGYFMIEFYGFAIGIAEDTKTGKYLKWNLSDINAGDIIFQTSKSSQSKAIQIATKSKYSHMGIVFIQENKYYVCEAVQPVKLTPLDKWILRGENNHFVLKRLKQSGKFLTKENLKIMFSTGEKFRGKDYDLFFNWSDDQIYCSELVWKIYKSIGIKIGELQKLRDFDLSFPIVQQKLKERYGENIPLNETVISPASIFESNMLIKIIEN